MLETKKVNLEKAHEQHRVHIEEKINNFKEIIGNEKDTAKTWKDRCDQYQKDSTLLSAQMSGLEATTKDAVQTTG